MLKNNIVKRTLSILFALGVWQIAAMLVNIDFLLPSPISVIDHLFALWQKECILSTVTAISGSFVKIVSGFLAGLLLGILLALIAARFSIVEDLLWPFLITIKSVPVASFVVIVLMWLTSKELSAFISFLMVLPIIYTNILEGIKNSSREMDKMAVVFKMPLGRKILYIWLPRIKPFLISACSVAIGLSWKAGVAAELIGIPDNTLGEMLQYARINFSMPDLLAWTLIIVFISIAFEKLFISLLKLIFRRIEKI